MIPTYELDGRQTVDCFHKTLDARGLTYRITPKWNGWERDGVLEVMDFRGRILYSVTYKRSTQHWGEKDTKVVRLRNGSKRHLAIRQLLCEMLGQTAPEVKVDPEELARSLLSTVEHAKRVFGRDPTNEEWEVLVGMVERGFSARGAKC